MPPKPKLLQTKAGRARRFALTEGARMDVIQAIFLMLRGSCYSPSKKNTYTPKTEDGGGTCAGGVGALVVQPGQVTGQYSFRDRIAVENSRSS